MRRLIAVVKHLKHRSAIADLTSIPLLQSPDRPKYLRISLKQELFGNFDPLVGRDQFGTNSPLDIIEVSIDQRFTDLPFRMIKNIATDSTQHTTIQLKLIVTWPASIIVPALLPNARFRKLAGSQLPCKLEAGISQPHILGLDPNHQIRLDAPILCRFSC